MTLPIARWRSDPTAFITEALTDSETGKPFVLNPSQVAFLRLAFELNEDGRLRYPELCYSAPKKSGKTALAAMIILVVTLLLGGRNAEAYCLANDIEQAQSRVFAAVRRIVEASPALRAAAHVTQSRIAFRELGVTIEAISSDYASAAGANPTITSFDELWAYTSEKSQRLWDEMVPVPTRRISARLTTTYAGWEGESTLLEQMYRRGLALPQVGHDLHAGDGLLMAWHHEPVAPWQDAAWLAQMRSSMRVNAYLRMIENRFVSGEGSFIEQEWYDQCVDPSARMLVSDRAMRVWVGVDAGVKRDSTAIVAVTWDHALKKVRLVYHKIFQPSVESPLDFEATIAATLRELRQRFVVREVLFDPWQMQSTAQQLQRERVPMREFAQSVGNLTAASSNLFELFKGRNLVLYDDPAIRLAVQHAVAIETPRGWRIGKEHQSHKIDVIVALAQACLGAVEGGTSGPIALNISKECLRRAAMPGPYTNRGMGNRWGPFG